MRNALILTGVWLGILVTAYAIVFWDQGIDRPLPISILEEQAASMPSEFVHPEGLYSLPIPMGWQVAEDTGDVELLDPNELVTVVVMALEETSFTSALEETFAWMDLSSDEIELSDGDLPDAWMGKPIVLTYATEDAGEAFEIRLQRVDALAVAMVSWGPPNALEALSANLDWIWEGLSVPAEDLLLL